MDSPNTTGQMQANNNLNSIVFIGNYLPRRCGIATFTTHLHKAIENNAANIDSWVVAMNDRPEGYAYPPQVRQEIHQDRLSDYNLAADLLNINHVDIVCLQHEYGIFGGERGSFIIELLSDLKMPVVTTLHTLLTDPTDRERHIILQLAALSDRLVVMSKRSIKILRDVYSVEAEKIVLIPHGVPDVVLGNPTAYKKKFGLCGRKVLLTFGLLSPGKGIETVIDALPEILREVPDVTYMVVGATHPHLKATQGEDYRINLHRRANKLGVEENIVFHDHFVDNEDLIDFVGAADIIVTPYLNRAQIISGPLSYAIGMGKAVVSTPFWHAEELLDNGRGRLFPFRDHNRLSAEVTDLLTHPQTLQDMGQKACDYGGQMGWQQVGNRYLDIFKKAGQRRLRKCIPAHKLSPLNLRQQALPEIKLDHLRRMTDGVGMLQHSKFNVPDRSHGYCVDDNARALIVAVCVQALKPHDRALDELISVYLSFLDHAFNADIGLFRNFMSYDRRWLEEEGSEDSHGRSIWALGTLIANGLNEGQVNHARGLFLAASDIVEGFTSPRSIAFSIIGLHAFLSRYPENHAIREKCMIFSDKFMHWFADNSDEDWPWLENTLTYDNARIPQALLMSARLFNDNEMEQAALAALTWLNNIQRDDSGRYFSAIGNHGWFKRGTVKAKFDQQPIEAAAMVSACIEAFYTTRDENWIVSAYRCLNWFQCDNELHVSLYDHATGGCRDGLQVCSVNENQGAESTLCWLMALLAIYQFRGQGENKHS
ncbi:MAG: glycosyltransferase [Gammaproteobacteria bacterium]|nr:glycosyltransferase [Gammaproteobacteria bacterium]